MPKILHTRDKVRNRSRFYVGPYAQLLYRELTLSVSMCSLNAKNVAGTDGGRQALHFILCGVCAWSVSKHRFSPGELSVGAALSLAQSMGRRRRGKGAGEGPTSKAARKEPKLDERWQRELDEALNILDAWEDVEDSELTTVYMQLPSILQMHRQALGRAQQASALARLMAALENGCRHPRKEVYVAAWETVHECCLVLPELAEAFVGNGTHRLAWEQLCTATAGEQRATTTTSASSSQAPSASTPSAVQVSKAMIGFLQVACEASEAALGALGPTELEALVCVVRVGGRSTRIAALELLLVLSDPTALDEEAENEDQDEGEAVAVDAVVASPFSPSGWLANSRAWHESMSTPMAIPSAAPSADDPISTMAWGQEWLESSLAASIVMNVVSAAGHGSQSEHLEGAGELSALADCAHRVLAATLRLSVRAATAAHAGTKAVEAVCEPPDAVIRTALESLSNLLVDEGAAGATEKLVGIGSCAGLSMDEEELLVGLFSLLEWRLGGAASGASGAREEGDSGEIDGVAGRALRCCGALLSSQSSAALLRSLGPAWRAALCAAAALPGLDCSSQLELLELLGLLASRCCEACAEMPADDHGSDAGLSGTLLHEICSSAVVWAQSAKLAALAPAVGLVGQLLALARAVPAASEEGGPTAILAAELARRLETPAAPDSLCAAAEAVAALVEDLEATEASGGTPAVEASVLRRAMKVLPDRLREALHYGNRDDEVKDRLGQAMELVDAATRASA
jgi:hypothetical protein